MLCPCKIKYDMILSQIANIKTHQIKITFVTLFIDRQGETKMVEWGSDWTGQEWI